MGIMADVTTVLSNRVWTQLREALRLQRQSQVLVALGASVTDQVVMEGGPAIGFRNNGSTSLTVKLNDDETAISYSPGQGADGPIYRIRVTTGASGGSLIVFVTAKSGGETVNFAAPGSTVGGSTTGVYGSSDGGTTWYPLKVTSGGIVSVTMESGQLIDLGAKADTAATSDTGTFSLIALFKRLLATTLAKGQTTASASLPVVLASDQNAVNEQADKVYIGGALRTLARATFDVNATTTVVVAGTASTKIYIVGIEFSVDTDATTFKLVEETTGDMHAAQTFMKGGGKVNNGHGKVLWVTAAADKDVSVTTATGKATGTLWYAQF